MSIELLLPSDVDIRYLHWPRIEVNYDVRSTDLLHAMSWKNLNDRHKMNKSVLMFKILNNHSAPNLKDKLITRDTNLCNYNLRNADINLSVPEPRTEYLKRVLDIVGLCLPPPQALIYGTHQWRIQISGRNRVLR